MLDELANKFRIYFNCKSDVKAIKNVLLAEINNLFAFKKITFESVNNLQKPMPLAYYAFNFVPSGGIKTTLVKDINFHLLNWFKEEIDTANKNRYSDLEVMQDTQLMKIEDKTKRKRKEAEFEKEKSNFIKLKYYITDTTQSKMYQYVDIINNTDRGSLLFVQDEFGDYFSEAKRSRDTTKNAFLNMLLDLHDGTFKPTDTTGTDREVIDNIGVSAILMSDYSVILEDERLLKEFKIYLKHGIARRSFIFYDGKDNIYNEIQVAEPETSEECINYIRSQTIKLKEIYNKTVQHYKFTVAANKRIKEYENEVFKKLKEIRKYSQKLPIEDTTINLDLENSTWKIIKLAVLLHILDNPESDKVQVEDFNNAVDHFNQMHEGLILLLKQQSISDYDKLFNYLLHNINIPKDRMDIRKLKIINNNYFAKWLEDALPIISKMAEEKGLGFSEISGDRNNKYFVLYDNNFTIENGKLVRINGLPVGEI